MFEITTTAFLFFYISDISVFLIILYHYKTISHSSIVIYIHRHKLGYISHGYKWINTSRGKKLSKSPTHLKTAKRCSSCLDNSCTFSNLNDGWSWEPRVPGNNENTSHLKRNKHLPNFGWHIVSSGEANNESCFKIDHQATRHEGSGDDTCAQSVPFRAWDFLATLVSHQSHGREGQGVKNTILNRSSMRGYHSFVIRKAKKWGMQATGKAAETNSSTISLKAMPNGWIPIKVFKRAKVLQGISHSNTWVF